MSPLVRFAIALIQLDARLTGGYVRVTTRNMVMKPISQLPRSQTHTISRSVNLVIRGVGDLPPNDSSDVVIALADELVGQEHVLDVAGVRRRYVIETIA